VDEPDPQLLRSAQRGDTRAFEELVRRYQADVWRLCFHLLGDRTMADDVAQDALVRAYRFLPRYRGDSKFSTWMFSITRNCCLDELRRTKRRRSVRERLEAQPQPTRGDPNVAIEVRDALALLPLELREPLVLIDMFGESYREAARVLRVPEGTVKSRVHRARAMMMRSLGAEGVSEI
jgi:RNA polymerase sigma-70 factor (ECF subfamily)